jgi:putative endonuclease
MKEHCYSVYMMQSTSRHVLYIGITSDLRARVWQHKHGSFEGFTDRYKCHRLVYYERYQDVHRAIGREKQLKGWRREKKDRLVETLNPHWKDLSEGWFGDETKGPSAALGMTNRQVFGGGELAVQPTTLKMAKRQASGGRKTQGPSTSAATPAASARDDKV